MRPSALAFDASRWRSSMISLVAQDLKATAILACHKGDSLFSCGLVEASEPLFGVSQPTAHSSKTFVSRAQVRWSNTIEAPTADLESLDNLGHRSPFVEASVLYGISPPRAHLSKTSAPRKEAHWSNACD
jgi:hypothetical protein